MIYLVALVAFIVGMAAGAALLFAGLVIWANEEAQERA